MGSCVYDHKLYYFFGGLGYNQTKQARCCTSQVIQFDPVTRHYEQYHIWHSPERLLTERRSVTTILFDKNLLCLGGINTHGYNINEMVCINMETRQW